MFKNETKSIYLKHWIIGVRLSKRIMRIITTAEKDVV